MNPVITVVLLVVSFAAFAVSIRRRWRLLMIGRTEATPFRVDRIGQRVQYNVRITITCEVWMIFSSRKVVS